MIKSEVCVWDKETAILFTVHTSKILQNNVALGLRMIPYRILLWTLTYCYSNPKCAMASYSICPFNKRTQSYYGYIIDQGRLCYDIGVIQPDIQGSPHFVKWVDP